MRSTISEASPRAREVGRASWRRLVRSMAMSGLRRALPFLIVLACLFPEGAAWSAERNKPLIFHEPRGRGPGSGLEPAQYFGVARQLYERVSVPLRFLANDADRLASPDEIEREFLAANPWLEPDMISVTCRRANLLDIRVCFGRDLFPRACGVNEDQKRLCPAANIAVPPVKP